MKKSISWISRGAVGLLLGGAVITAWGAERNAGHPGTSVLTTANWHDAFAPGQFSDGEIKRLERIPGFERSWIQQLQIPRNWKLNVSHFANAATFPLVSEEVNEDGVSAWHIKTDGNVVFYADKPRIPGWKNYRVGITMRGKGTVFPYLYGSSTALAPTLEASPITATPTYETHWLEMSDAASNQLGMSRSLALRISGDITVKSVELTAMPVAQESIVDGEVLDVSVLPQITSADYPDCNYTVKFQVNRVLEGEAVSRIIQLVCPGFTQGKRGIYADLKPNDKLKLHLVWFDSLPEDLRSNKLFDTLLELDLDSYYLLNAQKVENLGVPDIIFKDGVSYSSRFHAIEPLNPPLPEEAAAARLRQMAEDNAALDIRLTTIQDRAQWNRNFEEIWQKNQSAFQRLGSCFSSRTRSYVDMSKLFWGQVGKGFFALPEHFQLFREVSFPEENVAALQSLNDYLALNNIQLIVAVHPDYYDLAAHMMNPELGNLLDVNSAVLVKTLLDAGIEAVYTFDEIKRTAPDYEFSFLYPDNDHPGWGTQDAIASLLSKRLERFGVDGLGKKLPPTAFTFEMKPGWGGDAIRYPAGVASGTHEPDTPVIQRIYSMEGTTRFSDPASPILIIGNSHIQSPMPQGSLAIALARQSGILAHSYYAGGNGPAYVIPSNLLMRQDEFLKGKKVCIYLFNASIAGMPLLNLQDFDRLRSMMSERQVIAEPVLRSGPEHEFKPSDSFTDGLWSDFIRSHTDLPQIIGSSENQVICNQEFPEMAGDEDVDEELYLQLSFAQYPGYPIDLVVNGNQHRLDLVTRPMWRTEFFPVTPRKDGRLQIELLPGKEGRPVMLLRQAKLLQ